MLAPLAVLVVSPWEIAYARIWLYPASMLLFLACLLGSMGAVEWAEVLTASLLGGLLCWKATDIWPLFWGGRMVCVSLMLGPTFLLCRKKEDRVLACAMGSLCFELFFCLEEYMLFSFCVVRLGSRESLSLATACMWLGGILEQIRDWAHSGKNHALSMLN